MDMILDAIDRNDLMAVASHYNEVNSVIERDFSVTYHGDSLPNYKMHYDKVTPLKYAVYKGNLDAVKLLITLGADIDAQVGYSSATALFDACRLGENEIAHYLMDRNANVKRYTEAREYHPYRFSTYEMAIKLGDVKLLEKMANQQDFSTLYDRSLSFACATKDDISLVDYFLEKGANVNGPEYNQYSLAPIMIAAKSGNTEAVQMLLDNGAKADTLYPIDESRSHFDPINEGFYSALMQASRNGHVEIARILLEAGAGEKAGLSDLHKAVIAQDYDAVSQLIVAGTDVDTLDGYFLSPLHHALIAQDNQMLDLLKANGANLELSFSDKHDESFPAMGLPMFLEAKDSIAWLIDNGFEVNKTYPEYMGATILLAAAYYGKAGAVEALLENGADIDATTYLRQGVLHAASIGGNEETFRILLEYGAKVNQADIFGRTELHFATEHLDSYSLYIQSNEPLMDIANLLLEAGSDPLAKDNLGNLPVDNLVHSIYWGDSEPYISDKKAYAQLKSYGEEQSVQIMQDEEPTQAVIVAQDVLTEAAVLDEVADVSLPDNSCMTTQGFFQPITDWFFGDNSAQDCVL